MFFNFWKNQLNIKFKPLSPQKALPCVIPHVLSYYLLPLGWIMKKVMTIFVKRRPSWTPSWIFQNAQGWPKSTRRILKIDHLDYPKPSRKKLTLTFPGSTPWLPDYNSYNLKRLPKCPLHNCFWKYPILDVDFKNVIIFIVCGYLARNTGTGYSYSYQASRVEHIN